MRALILSLATIVLLSSCADSGNKSNSTTFSDQVPNNGAAKINQSEITSKQYSLKANLNFIGADSRKYKLYEGTGLETEVNRYFYSYSMQRRLNPTELDSVHSYCSVYVEAPSQAEGDDYEFGAKYRLLNGQFATSTQNQDVTFSLQLQGEAFNSFMLECRNVYGVSEIELHVGHLLEIEERVATN